jgi:hypothetical protein
MLPAGFPSAPRLDSLEPPPNLNIDPALYTPPATAPLPASPNYDAGGTSAPLPPQMAPLHPDTEAH